MKTLLLKDHLEKLYPFKTIGDLGGLTAAGRVLGISQSSLSHTIKTLEDILEVQLLKRHPKGISLTSEGEVLYEFSKKMFHQSDNVELQIKNFTNKHAGALKISTHETLATHVWPGFIKHISTIYPELQISLTSGRIDPIIHDLLNSNVDLALTVEPFSNQRLVKIPLYSVDFGIYVAHSSSNLIKFPLLKRKSVAIDDLDDIPILTDSHAHHKQGVSLPQYLALAGFKSKSSFTLNSFEAAINLASQGIGVCIIPRKNALPALKENKIKEIEVHGLKVKNFGEHTICASYLKSSSNRMIEPFVEALVDYAKK